MYGWKEMKATEGEGRQSVFCESPESALGIHRLVHGGESGANRGVSFDRM